MALSTTIQEATAELDARMLRVEAKAKREARFDIRRGSCITSRDARDNARIAATFKEQTYWKSYADELVRQGHR